MTRKTLDRAAVLLLLGLPPLRLAASGAVTDVVVSPSPAVAGRTVTVTVKGSGSCSARVDFGDGPPGAKITSLPATLAHMYAAPKTYVLRVYSYRDGTEAPGLSNCDGGADASLVVQPDPRVAARAVPTGPRASPA